MDGTFGTTGQVTTVSERFINSLASYLSFLVCRFSCCWALNALLRCMSNVSMNCSNGRPAYISRDESHRVRCFSQTSSLFGVLLALFGRHLEALLILFDCHFTPTSLIIASSTAVDTDAASPPLLLCIDVG